MKAVTGAIILLENKLATLFVRLPNLPSKSRQVIIKYLPYIILLIGALGVFQGLTTFFFKIARLIFSSPELLTPDIFVSSLTNLLIGSVLVASFLPLYRLKLAGWQIVFVTTLLTGVLNLIGNPLGVLQSVIFLYILFQIKDEYRS